MDIEQVKTMHLDGTDCVIVLTLADSDFDDHKERIHAQAQALFPERTVVVLPASMTIRALPTNGVYYRERFAEREIEIIAENEEALTKRLKELFPDN